MVKQILSLLAVLVCSAQSAVAGDVVVILSEVSELPLKNGKVAPVGVYLNELMIPVMTLIDQGQSVVFATPHGKPPVFDAMSDNAKVFGNDEKKYQRAKDLVRELKLQGDGASLLSFDKLASLKLSQIDGVLVPGGHAPLIDLAANRELGAFLKNVHQAAIPTGMICHGPIASVSALDNPEDYLDALSTGDAKKAQELAQNWIYSGYPMTIFSTPEEKIAEEKKLHGPVQFYPDDALKFAGGKMVAKAPGQSNVVAHKELVTGQNPASAEEFAKVFAKKLKQSQRELPFQARTFTTTDGEKISYSVGGRENGAPIVMIHGFPFSSAMWDAQVAALKKDFRVITYDMRGFGKSQAKQGPFTMEILVDDFIQLLDHEKISKTTVVGFSMGGFLALRAIERNPERFQALVLTNTRSAPDSDESKLRRTEALKALKTRGLGALADGFLKSAVSPETLQNRPELMKKLKGLVTGNNTASGIGAALFGLISRTDTTKSLAKIKVPTLILVGDEDAVTPLANARGLHDGISGSELVVVPHSGHMSPVENPVDFNQALVRFMRVQ